MSSGVLPVAVLGGQVARSSPCAWNADPASPLARFWNSVEGHSRASGKPLDPACAGVLRRSERDPRACV